MFQWYTWKNLPRSFRDSSANRGFRATRCLKAQEGHHGKVHRKLPRRFREASAIQRFSHLHIKGRSCPLKFQNNYFWKAPYRPINLSKTHRKVLQHSLVVPGNSPARSLLLHDLRHLLVDPIEVLQIGQLHLPDAAAAEGKVEMEGFLFFFKSIFRRSLGKNVENITCTCFVNLEMRKSNS